jgi:hypothetical protein
VLRRRLLAHLFRRPIFGPDAEIEISQVARELWEAPFAVLAHDIEVGWQPAAVWPCTKLLRCLRRIVRVAVIVPCYAVWLLNAVAAVAYRACRLLL